MKRIYMDHAATTPTDIEVVKEMEPYFTQKFGNPNSVHSFGQEAREAVEEARGKVAHLIGANSSEIVFTAGGTEADNYAIKEIGKVVKKAGIYFHTDSVQTTGHIPVDVNDLGVDMLSISGHKFYGPNGVGVLYLRKGTKIVNLIDGGAQEKNRRAGTENVAGIVGLGKAAELAEKRLAKGAEDRVVKLRDKLIKGIMDKRGNVRLNGHPTNRLPGNANLCFEFIEGESMLLNLDMKGVAASSGSACTSGSLKASHVLLAIGLPPEIAHGSLRLTLGKDNTEEEIDYVIDILPGIIEKLRGLSPFNGDWEGLK